MTTERTMSNLRIMSHERTYWGVTCRSCKQPVAFDIAPYHQAGLGILNLRPGTINCASGHLHIYFPHDYHFFQSASLITESDMQANRDAYWHRNPSNIDVQQMYR